MAPVEILITWLLIFGAGVYFLAGTAFFLGGNRAGYGLFGCAWLVNALVLVMNGVICGHPPFGNMYHVLIFLSFSFLPMCLVLHFKEKQDWLHLYFAWLAVVPLVGALFLDRDVFWRRAPALESPWFAPHVAAYMISYALAGVAFVLNARWFVRDRYRADDRCPGAAYQILRLAVVFMTLGLGSGALWADEVWGGYWSWDRKEVWSLITWLLYVVHLHCWRTPSLRRGAFWTQFLGFIALLVTFLLVNLLPQLASFLHSYS
ncbi:MAG: cytochrome c biogenesis protein CcsA [Verrucomicrobiae bacterium]|nr:cytochrome c biogenesis protein CcsA [Verrucomicrobiae bacterium]